MLQEYRKNIKDKLTNNLLYQSTRNGINIMRELNARSLIDIYLNRIINSIHLNSGGGVGVGEVGEGPVEASSNGPQPSQDSSAPAKTGYNLRKHAIAKLWSFFILVLIVYTVYIYYFKDRDRERGI